MNNDFSRILALLRKERNLSQKKAATDLGIAQALLSHYENGKRECGLAFLVKAADYYNVSTDYLLGRTAATDGSHIAEGDIMSSEEIDAATRKSGFSGKNMSAMLAKKMLIGGVDVIYSLLTKYRNPKLTAAVTEFFSLSVYTCFRLVHRANPKNDSNIFGIKEEMAFRSAVAGRNLCEGRAVVAADEVKPADLPQLPLITMASLEAEFGKQSNVLMSLVKNSEKAIS
ncbi:MAG: helix-turn-helix transcriptional regulator [Oscillospiraceae bacterium]|nr:helix-turn-helix transcriptional regulator [Oscillospiraceae bacterium]